MGINALIQSKSISSDSRDGHFQVTKSLFRCKCDDNGKKENQLNAWQTEAGAASGSCHVKWMSCKHISAKDILANYVLK